MDFTFHRGPVVRIFPTETERSTLRDADGGSSHLVRDTDLPPPVKRRRTMSDPDFVKKTASAMNSALACLEFMKTAVTINPLSLKPGAPKMPPSMMGKPPVAAPRSTSGSRFAYSPTPKPANVQQVVSPKPAPVPAPVSQASPAAHPAAVPPAPATAAPPPPAPTPPVQAQPVQTSAGPAVSDAAQRSQRAQDLLKLRAAKHETRDVRKDLQARMGKLETTSKGREEELGRLREIAAGTTPEDLAKFQKATGTASPTGWKSTAWDVGSMMAPMMAAGMVLPPSLQLPAMLALQMGGHQKLRAYGQKKLFGYRGDEESAAARAAWARGHSPEQYLAAAKARQEAASAPAPAATPAPVPA